MVSIYGYFKDINNNVRYDVLLTRLTSSQNIEYSIEEDSDTICFNWSNPVTIQTDYADTFTHIIIKQAVINLIVNENLKSVFFASNERDFNVTISVHDGPVLFKGYLDPLIFNEPFEKDWTSIELSCSDKISTLQYKKYASLSGVLPNLQQKPIDIINIIADYIGLTVDVTSLPNNIKSILNNTMINSQIWYGDSPDDWKNCDEVLEEIGKYCGIWFSQEADNKLRLFSWHKSSKDGNRYITLSDYASNDTNISVSDVYTQIKLTCNLEKQEKLVEFGTEDMKKVYPSMFKFLEEYISEGSGSGSCKNFIKLVDSDGTITTNYSYRLLNYANVLESNKWEFPHDPSNNVYNYLDIASKNPNNPQQVLAWLRANPGNGAFLSFGKTEKQTDQDNAPLNSLTMNDSLLISVMGKDNYQDNTTTANFSSYICQYKGNATSITPPNTAVTNYIVISGKIMMNPLYPQSYIYSKMHKDKYGQGGSDSHQGLYLDSLYTFENYKNTISYFYTLTGLSNVHFWIDMYRANIPEITDNEDGAFYLHRFFTGKSGNEHTTTTPMMYGDLKMSRYQKYWEYKMSCIDGHYEEVDTISKIPVLVCQLKVGNKYCVERFDKGPAYWNKFEWLTEGELPWDSEHQQRNSYFTIGINPKIGDFVIGTEYDISNTINYYDNIEGKGTAIPIKTDDMLSGDFTFKIVRPADVTFNYIHKRTHGWWFWKHTHWTDEQWPIIQKLSSIIVKNLKLELVSDKAKVQNGDDDADLVYASDISYNYIEPHEDDVMLSTMLTSYECQYRGLDLNVSPSHLITTSGTPYLGMSSTGSGNNKLYIKPEHYYVNNFFEEYSIPRTIIQTTINLDSQFGYILKPYSYNFILSRNYSEMGYFVPVMYEANLKEDSINLTMKNMS